ncbi:hypothetical protein NPX13_g9 [Xylaria arbuscula]|uniref:Uncharacterized protein n=1 Tax=Xylaria arbuscula TaxID=114810 RepID=A0A9W8NPG1_9PEZI|nr:hypothetical protein NPX13_g9 [Xylaria arbuscula]
MKGCFATQVWEEFSNLNTHVKHQIYLLSTVDEDSAIKDAENFEKRRANCWEKLRRFAPSSSTQVESKEAKPQDTQTKAADLSEHQASTSGVSICDEKNRVESLVLREARKAVTDYIKVCEEEIRDYCTDSWSLLAGGFKTVEIGYKKTRAIVKKAIEVSGNNTENDSEKGDKKEAEELLKKLRGVWQDARNIHLDGRDSDYDDSDLEEEVEMGYFV